jgi:phage-related tail fiber protein
MAYKTIHTNYGLQRMAQAEASGVPINLTAMAVGDGGGNPTTPSETQTNLVREIAGTRHAPNRVYQDPTNPLLFTAELIVPASLGGFVIREVGVFDETGALFAVANVPNTYKPSDTEGAYADTVIRMQFLVSNASVVTLQVDPNVAVATQSWITNTITLPYLLKGGTTGQYLSKKSNADGDVQWVDPTTANVIVSTVEEVQTLAAGQAAVTLTTCTTIGLAAYIEGVRLRPDQWTPHPTDKSKLTLAQSYPDGTKVDFVQNDPASFVPTPLIQSKNLSDIPDQGAARANIGVDSKANTDTFAPAGHIAYTARNTAPAGWLKANGAAVSRTAYAALFAAIGTTYGAGDGFNTFNLPDLRGEFMRGWDDGRGVDASRTIGSSQTDAQQRVQGSMGWVAFVSQSAASGALSLTATGVSSNTTTGPNSTLWNINFDNASVARTAAENRPRNVAMLACIKY